MSNYWLPIETEWHARYGGDLQPCLAITQSVHQFVANIATHSDLIGAPQANIVTLARLLVRRLGEELRSVEVLASAGHGFQAASAACNLFELSHLLTCATADEEEAVKYLTSTDRKHLPWKVKEMVRRSGKIRCWTDERCKEEYDRYGFLCGFKHSNPVLQGVLVLPINADLWLGQYTLAEGCWSVLSAVGTLVMQFLQPSNALAAIEECTDLLDRTESAFPSVPVDSPSAE